MNQAGARGETRTRRSRRLARASFHRRGLTLPEMAVVVIVMGFIAGLLAYLLVEILSLTTSEDEAQQLSNDLTLARNKAIQSNQVILFEFQLNPVDDDTYRAYHVVIDEDGERQEEGDIREVTLEIHSIVTSAGSRLEEGELVVHFLPSGVGEEMAIYFGESGETPDSTLFFSRYRGRGRVESGEVLLDLRDDNWAEDSRNSFD